MIDENSTLEDMCLKKYTTNFIMQPHQKNSIINLLKSNLPIRCPNCWGIGKVNEANPPMSASKFDIERIPCSWCSGNQALAIPWSEWAGRDSHHIIDQGFKVNGKGTYFGIKEATIWKT